MPIKRHIRRYMSENPIDHPLKQQRITEFESTGLTRTNIRPLNSVVEKNERRHQSCQWTGDTDVKQCFGIRYFIVHGNDRSECSERTEGHRQKKREATLQLVAAGLNVMSQFVAGQDKHQCRGEEECLPKVLSEEEPVPRGGFRTGNTQTEGQ